MKSHKVSPDKTKQSHTKYRHTICTLYTPDPEEYKIILDLKINNTVLPLATYAKVLGLTLDPHTEYTFTTSLYKHSNHYT